MFQKIGDQLKSSADNALRMASLATVIALSLAIMVSFLSAAVFMIVLQNFGSVLACLACAGIFCLFALFSLVWYMQLKKARRAAPRPSGLAVVMSDPVIVATGVQIVRGLGMKRVLPLLAIGGIVFGLMAQRRPEEHQDVA